jgi:hypothetical protein
MIAEWIKRGYKNTMTYIWKIDDDILMNKADEECNKPFWLNADFTQSHKSNLLRKSPEYYSKFNWNVSNDLPYIWPKV